jgi:signal transduction histidine kinase
MSLRLKFGVLIGLLGLAVLLSLGASWWTFSTLQSEVREPFRSMSVVLVSLSEAKQAVEAQRKIIHDAVDSLAAAPPDDPTAQTPDQILLSFDRAHQAAQQSLRMIDASDWKIRSGTSSLGNLTDRIPAAAKLGREYLELRFRAAGSPAQLKDASLTAREKLDSLHDLMERLEGRVIAETTEALKFDAELRSRLLLVLALAFAIVLLACLQGIVLIRRWILRPVEQLRLAAAKIAAGDFAHRIPLASSGAANPDELHQLSVEVNHMAAMVKSMQDDRVERERFAALGEMVRIILHNMRSPLAGIRGLAELTRSELPATDPSATDMREYQDRIIGSVDRFGKWLNDLLSAAKPLSVTPELTSVVPWVTGLVEAHRPMAQSRGVELTLDVLNAPTQATIDARLLEQALSAILSNALEATSSPEARGPASSGGVVAIQINAPAISRQSGQDRQIWTISVSDQGHGIPPDLRDSIFRPYFTTKREGTGIGLAIALQVVKAHGGLIRVDSPLNGSGGLKNGFSTPPGTCFTISLPI